MNRFSHYCKIKLLVSEFSRNREVDPLLSMESSTRYLCAVPFAKVLTLSCFILVTCFDKGLAHIGRRCFHPWCAKNAYCDMYGICRCRQGYPVQVNEEECRRGVRYRNKCQYGLECQYYDKNSNCSSTVSGRICDCNPGLTYDEQRKRCMKVEVNNTREIISSVIIGISAFIVITFIGCVAFKHCHQRCRQGETGYSQFLLRMRYCRMNPPASDVECPRMPSNEIILSNEADKSDLPPSYEEAIKQVVTEGKG